MRKSILLIIVFSTINLGAKSQSDKNPAYIRFLHVGEQTKPVFPLTVSTKQIDLKMMERQFDLGSTYVDRVVGIEPYRLREALVVTNKHTFNRALHFIYDNKSLATKSKQHCQFGSFEVIINNDKNFFLTPDSSKIFFKNLTNYLRKKRCDSLVVEQLAQIYNRLLKGI